jgi:hypothetical protein
VGRERGGRHDLVSREWHALRYGAGAGAGAGAGGDYRGSAATGGSAQVAGGPCDPKDRSAADGGAAAMIRALLIRSTATARPRSTAPGWPRFITSTAPAWCWRVRARAPARRWQWTISLWQKQGLDADGAERAAADGEERGAARVLRR